MRKQIITPQHLDRLPVIPVVYVPQNIHTFAIQVNHETIGAMSLEFGTEISVSHPNHRWLAALLERSNPKGDRGFIERPLNLGDWLVIIEHEVLVFPDDTFFGTFAKDEEPAHLQGSMQYSGLVTSEGQLTGVSVAEGATFMDLPVGLTNEGKNETPAIEPFPTIN